ncbi:MAG: type II toxin-antitoxin system VapC family toxin [Spirochaetales bacterium]|jgi:predicted nucleic acid-binding protein|nr:type II toxin-antitoxin system VapC family toxin [Spirochaetales bacterium]
MNGGNGERFVLDTNTIILFLDGKIGALPEGARLVSIITEMELLAFPNLTREGEKNIQNFLERVMIYPLTAAIKDEAIRLRRFGNPHLKLPDAIIAATAINLEAALVTNDAGIHALTWPGLFVAGAA